MSRTQVAKALRLVTNELKNFQEIANHILPREDDIPVLDGIDVYGGTAPLNGVFGGDHIIYVDFKKRFDLHARIKQATAQKRLDIVENLERCQRKAGIVILDVAGHHATDVLLAAMLHLFENINTRFYNASSSHKFVTMLYGDISEDATFRFLSAAHPDPIVFSNKHDRFMEVSKDLCTSFPPIGTLPSHDTIDRNRMQSVLGFKDQYQLNEWRLMGTGDILLLYTDGLLEHVRNSEQYFPHHLENKIRQVKHLSAWNIFGAIMSDFLQFAEPSDDVSFVVIKRT